MQKKKNAFVIDPFLNVMIFNWTLQSIFLFYYFFQSILYNCTNGKLTRGFTVALTLKLLNKNDQLSDEKMREAYVLGWCVELVIIIFSNYILKYEKMPKLAIIFTEKSRKSPRSKKTNEWKNC